MIQKFNPVRMTHHLLQSADFTYVVEKVTTSPEAYYNMPLTYVNMTFHWIFELIEMESNVQQPT